MKNSNLKKISVTAMLSAIAFLLTFVFKFKVMFLTFDMKDAIISIVSLIFGPIYGICSAGLVAFLEFISISDTGVYGLIMNFLASGTFALTCGLIYKYKRSFSGAILSVVMSVVSVTAVMLLANIFITPYYMGVETSEVEALLPGVLLPFNLCKTVLNSAALLIIYKPITTALKKTGFLQREQNSSGKFGIKSILLIVVSAIKLICSGTKIFIPWLAIMFFLPLSRLTIP